jgi:hypothetical protein
MEAGGLTRMLVCRLWTMDDGLWMMHDAAWKLGMGDLSRLTSALCGCWMVVRLGRLYQYWQDGCFNE